MDSARENTLGAVNDRPATDRKVHAAHCNELEGCTYGDESCPVQRVSANEITNEDFEFMRSCIGSDRCTIDEIMRAQKIAERLYDEWVNGYRTGD
jgi:hypothetical protein